MTQVEPDPAGVATAGPDTPPSDSIGEPGQSASGLPGGWVAPPQASGQGGRRRLLIGCLVGALLVGVASIVLPLLALAILDGSSSGGPNLISSGLGTGGSACDVSGVASSFPVGVPIRSVLTLEPALPAGDTVTVKLEKDGVELVEARQMFTSKEPTPCIYGTLPELEVGHYRIEFAVSSYQGGPLDSEFDVTP